MTGAALAQPHPADSREDDGFHVRQALWTQADRCLQEPIVILQVEVPQRLIVVELEKAGAQDLQALFERFRGSRGGQQRQ
jgi:hypothetical protein